MTETNTVRLKFSSRTLYDLIRKSTGFLLFPKKTSGQLNQEIFNVLCAGYFRAKYERIGNPKNIDDKLATAEKIFVLYVDKHLGIDGLIKYCDDIDVTNYLAGHIALSKRSGQLPQNKKRIGEISSRARKDEVSLVQEINGIFSHDTFDGLVDRLMFADSLRRVVYDIPSQDRFLAFKDAHGKEVEYREKRVLHDIDTITKNIRKLVPDILNPDILTSPFQDFNAQAEQRHMHYVSSGEDLDAKLKGPNQVVEKTIKIYAQDTNDWFLRKPQKDNPVRIIMLNVIEESIYARKVDSGNTQPSGETGRHTRKEYYLVFEINQSGVLSHVLTCRNPSELKTFEGEGTTEAQIKAKVGKTNYKPMETYLHAKITTTYKHSFVDGLNMAITSRRFSGKNNANPVEEYSLELIGGNGVKYRIEKVLLNPDGPYKMEIDDYTGEHSSSELLFRRGLTLLNKSNGKH